MHATMQNRLQLFVLCCGTRFAQTSPRTACGAVLSPCICYLYLSLLQQLKYNLLSFMDIEPFLRGYIYQTLAVKGVPGIVTHCLH